MKTALLIDVAPCRSTLNKRGRLLIEIVQVLERRMPESRLRSHRILLPLGSYAGKSYNQQRVLANVAEIRYPGIAELNALPKADAPLTGIMPSVQDYAGLHYLNE